MTLIVLGAFTSEFVLFAVRAIHRHARWFLESRWGRDGWLRRRDDAYDSLYDWAVHATRHGIHAERRLGFCLAFFLVIVGLLLCAWARDRKRLRELAKRPAR